MHFTVGQCCSEVDVADMSDQQFPQELQFIDFRDAGQNWTHDLVPPLLSVAFCVCVWLCVCVFVRVDGIKCLLF